MPHNRVQLQKGLADDGFERLYPAALSRRGGLSQGMVRLALARGIQVSAMRSLRVLRDTRPSTAAMPPQDGL
jgi:hypothetical protein